MNLYKITDDQNQRAADLVEEFLQQRVADRGGHLVNLIAQDWSLAIESGRFPVLSLAILPVQLTPGEAQQLLDVLHPVEPGSGVES